MQQLCSETVHKIVHSVNYINYKLFQPTKNKHHSFTSLPIPLTFPHLHILWSNNPAILHINNTWTSITLHCTQQKKTGTSNQITDQHRGKEVACRKLGGAC